MKKILTYALFESYVNENEIYLKDIFQELTDIGYQVDVYGGGAVYVRVTVKKPPFLVAIGKPFKYDGILIDSVESSIEYMKSNGFQSQIKYVKYSEPSETLSGVPDSDLEITYLRVEFLYKW